MNTIIASNRVRTVAPSSVYDIDFEEWINHNNTQGYYLPVSTTLDEANDLVLTLKSIGVWSKIHVLGLFAFADPLTSDCSFVDLKRVVDMTVVGTLTNTVNGVQGDGSTGRLETGFNSITGSVNFEPTNAGRGVGIYKERDVGSVNMVGVLSSTSFETLKNQNTDKHRFLSRFENIGASVDLSGTGLMAQYRDDLDVARLYKGVNETITTQAGNPNLDSEYIIFGSGDSLFSDVGLSYFYLSESLTKTEHEALRSAFNTYLTNLGLTTL